MATFVRQCEFEEVHIPHVYVKTWVKAELPLLRDPERYPDQWKAEYKCPGIEYIEPPGTWDCPVEGPDACTIPRYGRCTARCVGDEEL